MATFNLIIKKVANLDNNIFSYNYDETDKISGIQKIFFYILNNLQLNKCSSKFISLNETINNFYFSKKDDNEKKEFITLFNKIQKIYHTLNRFVYLYKVKKSKLIVDTDMQLNKINLGDLNVICIYHVNTKYLFKIDDLLKMIYMSLTNCFSFFAEPISIKNPYNNISFGKSILYYIYYYLISNGRIQYIKPEYLDIFFKFKECNFNMTKFVDNYEYILREYAIKNYMNNTSKSIIKHQILHMIDDYNSNIIRNHKKILIDPEFPDNELISIMKPYLYLKLKSNYSLIGQNKSKAKNKLNIKLKEFQNYNPVFGRKIIKFKDVIYNEKTKRVKSHFGFNTRHKKFNSYTIEKFMNNHLTYKYDENENNNNEDEDEDDDYNSDEEHNNAVRNIRYFLAELRVSNNRNIERIPHDQEEEYEDEQDEEEDEEQYDQQDEEEDDEQYDEEDEEEYNDSVS